MGTGFVPEYYVDITPYMAAKEAAIMAHESQEPHRFVAATRIHNRFRAAQMNAPDGHYMEAIVMINAFLLLISEPSCHHHHPFGHFIFVARMR